MYLLKFESKLKYISKNYICHYRRIRTPLFYISFKTKSYKKVTLCYPSVDYTTTDWLDSNGVGVNKRLRGFLTIVNRNKIAELMLSDYKST